ncbi:hypothetical protein FA95DRAFT_1601469 [Auriscalpium vulgare]|uniref:Uncharacterized protein n=1 Tax=Auriscalpium vulgare TaxID=40419 RepID=A0ACB8SA52_9AGAM|nr:hypothetical protein FA95DRAFT_1601469 [Auriscalpium vulgare]
MSDQCPWWPATATKQFGMMSMFVKEKLHINEVVLGTAFGIAVGPHAANIFDPRSWSTSTDNLTREVMRVVLATGLFAIGVELPQLYMLKHAKDLLIMVLPTMAFGWVVSAVFIHSLFPGLDFVSALAISACLTPTDPTTCAAIMTGSFAVKHVPANVRRLLAAESASNDGFAYPFLSLSIYLTTEASRRSAIGKWFLIGWLYQVILGITLGTILGLVFATIMKYTHRKGLIDRESYVAQYLALGIFTIGITSTIGSDDLLAAFAAGSAMSWDGHFKSQTENEVFSSVIDLVLNCACFVYIGAWMPFDQFNSFELGLRPWRLIVLFVALLLFRRIPFVMMVYSWVPEIRSWKEALFSGHFGKCYVLHQYHHADLLVATGPMGVGAIFISTLAQSRLVTPESPPRDQEQLLAACLQPIVAFVVLGSIMAHGLSIPFFAVGREVRSRTLSLSRTPTSNQPDAPTWLLSVRHLTGPSSGLDTPIDVEQRQANGLDQVGEALDTLPQSADRSGALSKRSSMASPW